MVYYKISVFYNMNIEYTYHNISNTEYITYDIIIYMCNNWRKHILALKNIEWEE